MNAAEQIDRVGRVLVGSPQPLGDQQGLAGEIQRLLEQAEDIVDATDPVLDLTE